MSKSIGDILRDKDIPSAVTYSREILKGRWLEGRRTYFNEYNAFIYVLPRCNKRKIACIKI